MFLVTTLFFLPSPPRPCPHFGPCPLWPLPSLTLYQDEIACSDTTRQAIEAEARGDVDVVCGNDFIHLPSYIHTSIYFYIYIT